MIIETRENPDAKYKVKVKRGSAGLGLFAEEQIPAGKRIIEYVGIVKSSTDEDANKYIFNVSSKIDIDGSPRYNIARYANHSCEPNAESEIRKGHVFIKSLRDIEPGEEIVYDYGEDYFNMIIRPIGCRCSRCKRS